MKHRIALFLKTYFKVFQDMLFKMTKTLKGQIKLFLPDFKDNFIVGSDGSNLNDELA